MSDWRSERDDDQRQGEFGRRGGWRGREREWDRGGERGGEQRSFSERERDYRRRASEEFDYPDRSYGGSDYGPQGQGGQGYGQGYGGQPRERENLGARGYDFDQSRSRYGYGGSGYGQTVQTYGQAYAYGGQRHEVDRGQVGQTYGEARQRYREQGYGQGGGLMGQGNEPLQRVSDGESARMFGGAEGVFRGRGPKNYTRSDERIRDDVNDRLSDDAWLDASEIEVLVSDAEVTLSGAVNDRNDKRRAEDIAEQVSGVRHVQNNLRVQPRSHLQQGAGSSGTEAAARTTGGQSVASANRNAS